ncbi:MAG: GNAT family N-acetyltransferase [Thioalkalivibrionaceae bacterium]
MASAQIIEVTWLGQQVALRAVRTSVFIQEQNIPEALEWDGIDPVALHWLAISTASVAFANIMAGAALSDDLHDHAIGTVRLLPNGQIGRLAVLSHRRCEGIGSMLLCAASHAAHQHGLEPIWLNAQVDRIKFYQRHGFMIVSEPFIEAGIPHRRMQLSRSTAQLPRSV